MGRGQAAGRAAGATKRIMSKRIARTAAGLLGGVGALGLLYWVGRHDYLLFHSLAELFAVAVGISVFLIAWNARRYFENTAILLLGMAFPFVCIIALVHTLAYKGMGVLPGTGGANLPTQLWVAGRGLETVTFLLAPLVIGRRLRAERLLLAYALVTAALFASIFVWRVFPTCYLDGPGGVLTPFKIAAEYVYALFLAASCALLWWRRAAFEQRVLRLLLAAAALNLLAGLAFTSYVSVYGFANALGHLLRIVAFVGLYQAIVVTALQRPYELLFRELKAREEALETAQRAQEQMTQFIVHDLRSPLTSIFAGIDTLRQSLPQEAAESDKLLLDASMVSSSWMLTLINSLLDASRLESGKMVLQPRPLPAAELLRASLAHVRPWADLGGVQLVLECAPEVGAVQADEELTVRVLVNLLSNAIKWSPSGAEVRLTARPTAEGAVAFAVQDHGPGVPAEWAQRVFEPFGQVEARRAGAHAGTGLGLTFCRLAVEAQAGRIYLESETGTGTTVHFTLPGAPAAADSPLGEETISLR